MCLPHPGSSSWLLAIERPDDGAAHTDFLGADANNSLQTEHPHLHFWIDTGWRSIRLLCHFGRPDWSASDLCEQIQLRMVSDQAHCAPEHHRTDRLEFCRLHYWRYCAQCRCRWQGQHCSRHRHHCSCQSCRLFLRHQGHLTL